MDKGFFLRLCKYFLRRGKIKKRKMLPSSQCCYFLCWWFCVHASMVSVAKVEGNLQYLRPLYSERVIGHCTKEFHLFPGVLLLIWATRSGMKKGWLRRAPQPKLCRQLTASCYSLFRNSWSTFCLQTATGFALRWICIFVLRLILSVIKYEMHTC